MTVDTMGHVTEVNEHTVTLPTTPIVIDDTLSTESTNPVENRVVTQAINQLANLVYPIGSIYMSVNATNPGSLFGGTWVAWGTGRVPVGINTSDTNFNTVEKTGGASTVALTTNQMPAHTHNFTGIAVNTATQNAYHTHNFDSNTDDSGAHIHNIKFRVAALTGGTAALIAGIDATNVANDVIASSGTHKHHFIGNTGFEGSTHAHSVTAAGSNSNTGGGSAHNNLQPYITCYMWKRTA